MADNETFRQMINVLAGQKELLDRIRTVLNETMSSGLHSVNFEGSRYASGVYFYRLEAGDKVFQQKMMLVK